MVNELRKVDQLTDGNYLIERILTPALRYAHERELVTQMEVQVLLETAKLGVAKASDLQEVMPEMNERQRTYQIGKLVERGMLTPIREGARQYTVGFANNFLIRGVIRSLSKEGFIPDALNTPK
jgi:Fic family protein